uniref:Uncharacterized protein n=1 Tax=Anopheles atroparvus TaxID=41427 RepID=A0A182JLR4_ANOAO
QQFDQRVHLFVLQTIVLCFSNTFILQGIPIVRSASHRVDQVKARQVSYLQLARSILLLVVSIKSLENAE